jgi:hypothetical protein
VTVRQRIDQIAAEPPVRDLGYAADQRLVAGALLGLQLLADEIDTLKAEYEHTRSLGARSFGPLDAPGQDDDDDRDDVGGEDDVEDGADIADIVDQLAELTAQVKKLTKAVERGGSGKQKKLKKSKRPNEQLALE